MSQPHLQEMLEGIVLSISRAQHHVWGHQIQLLKGFFPRDKDGRPDCLEIAIPKSGLPGDQVEYQHIKVPFITLVNPSQMAIDSLKIQFKADIAGVSVLPASRAKEGPLAPSPSEPAEGTTASSSTSEKTKAKITLRVRQVEVSESIARIVTQLNRHL